MFTFSAFWIHRLPDVTLPVRLALKFIDSNAGTGCFACKLLSLFPNDLLNLRSPNRRAVFKSGAFVVRHHNILPERVQRADGDRSGTSRSDAGFHLLDCLLIKGDGEDVRRRHMIRVDEVQDAFSDDCGFATPGPRDDDGGACEMVHGFALVFVKVHFGV